MKFSKLMMSLLKILKLQHSCEPQDQTDQAGKLDKENEDKKNSDVAYTTPVKLPDQTQKENL